LLDEKMNTIQKIDQKKIYLNDFFFLFLAGLH